MDLKYYILGTLLYLYFQIKKSEMVKITYINCERPKVNEFDNNYFKKFILTSRRHSRRDERHYVELHVETLFAVNNNFKLDFYFYQFLTNRYQPSFVEVHLGFCDLLDKDKLFFGPGLKRALGNPSCPVPPGKYDLTNMTVMYVPNGFPFAKGRIYCNGSHIANGVTKTILSGSIDMEVKTIKI